MMYLRQTGFVDQRCIKRIGKTANAPTGAHSLHAGQRRSGRAKRFSTAATGY